MVGLPRAMKQKVDGLREISGPDDDPYKTIAAPPVAADT
jgi:hypothetical protein